MWRFWRQVQYGAGFSVFWIAVIAIFYLSYFHTDPTCFDGAQNGLETGVDCGGACTRICAFEVQQPTVSWARSFRVSDTQYNAVGYIENKNLIAASPEVRYTFTLFDEQGLITSRSGTTILPPDSAYPVFEGRIETGGRTPTQTFLELAPIELWLPAQEGPDQFSTVDRVLSNSDAKPRLDATIRNNSLTEAERVEVVATIFDRNGNALTSSRTFIDDFAPRSEAQAVFTWPEPIAKTIRSCEVPTDVVLAIDLSGSMNNDQDEPPEPITSVLGAAEAFVSRLRDGDQVGLITYATEALLNKGLTANTQSVREAISALFIDPSEEAGSTNQGDAFVKAQEAFSSPSHSSEARKVLVLLTDGLATAPDEEPETYALMQADAVKAQGVSVYSIGLGEQVNMEFVTALASSPLQAYNALSVADINRIYETITSSLCEDGAAHIEIIPKTDASFMKLEG